MPSLKWIFTGALVIIGSGLCGHWLNAEDLNSCNNHSFSFGILAGMGSNGMFCGLVGASVHSGQWHSSSSRLAAAAD